MVEGETLKGSGMGGGVGVAAGGALYPLRRWDSESHGDCGDRTSRSGTAITLHGVGGLEQEQSRGNAGGRH